MVRRRVLISRVTKHSRKGILPFSSISLVNWMLVFCLFKCSWLRYVDDTITAVRKNEIDEFHRNLEKRTKNILLYAFRYMSLFPGFPVKTGRVALTRQVQWAETACETVKFPPFSFYPDKEVHVQITTNHWNNSLSNYIHEATVSWVQLVDYEGFQVSKRLSSFNPFIYLFT